MVPSIKAEEIKSLAWRPDPATMASVLTRRAYQIPRHIDLISDTLASAAFKPMRVLIEVAPGHGKSSLASMWFPAWYLSLFPDKRVHVTSYEFEKARKWSKAVRDIVRENWSDLGCNVNRDADAAHSWETNVRDERGRPGGMSATGIEGPLTGDRLNILVIDDPVKDRAEARSKKIRERNWEWWTDVAQTRLEPGASVALILTRWHSDDLAGRLLKEMAAGGPQWTRIHLPALAEANDILGRAIGEACWPEKWPADCEAFKTAMRVPSTWNALYQQRPSAEQGQLFKKESWQFWTQVPRQPSGRPLLDKIIMSWDCAFKDTEGSSYVVGQVWGRTGADFWLLDQTRGHFDFSTTLVEFQKLVDKWPWATMKLVEDKANGPAVIQMLRHRIPGIYPVQINQREGDKYARAEAVEPFVRSRNVYIPNPETTPWVREFLNELTDFPNGDNDDQVDALSMALAHLEPAAWRSLKDAAVARAAADAAPKDPLEARRRVVVAKFEEYRQRRQATANPRFAYMR